MWEGGQGRGQREQGSRPRATCHGVAGPSENGGAFKESPSPSGGRGSREAPPLGSPRGQTCVHLQRGDQEEAVHSPGPAGEARPSLTGE